MLVDFVGYPYQQIQVPTNQQYLEYTRTLAPRNKNDSTVLASI